MRAALIAASLAIGVGAGEGGRISLTGVASGAAAIVLVGEAGARSKIAVTVR